MSVTYSADIWDGRNAHDSLGIATASTEAEAIEKAKAWAKAHGYRYGKVHTTDQYIRIRQSSPKGKATMRTIPFGTKGIRAVVAREMSTRSPMARTVQARRRRR